MDNILFVFNIFSNLDEDNLFYYYLILFTCLIVKTPYFLSYGKLSYYIGLS